MSCEGNGMSDERIGETLIKEVIKEELKNVSSSSLIPPSEVEPEEEKVVNQLGKMIRIVGDRLQGDKEFQDAIDGVAQAPGSVSEKFEKVANQVFKLGITWENIAVLFYAAGKLSVRLVENHCPQLVKNILTWTVNFFKDTLLGWIQNHGGWINSFSELAMVTMQTVPFTKSHAAPLVIIFVAGLAVGSVITWRLAR